MATAAELINKGMRCPGLYCGRTEIGGNDSWSDCGACPQGFRVSNNISRDISKCLPCLAAPSAYAWMYLGFMTIMALIMHWFFIDMAAKKQS